MDRKLIIIIYYYYYYCSYDKSWRLIDLEYNTEILHQVRQYLLLLLLLIFITIYLILSIIVLLFLLLNIHVTKANFIGSHFGSKNFTSYTLNFCYFLSFKIF